MVVSSHNKLIVDRDYESSFLYLHKALEIVGWGRHHISTVDVPIEERGEVFDDIFFVSLRCRLLMLYQQVCDLSV